MAQSLFNLVLRLNLYLLYHFIDKFTYRYNAGVYLKLSDDPDLSGEINE